jgi:capsid protein
LAHATLTGRYDQVNFTSARAAKLDEDAHFRPLQNWAARLVALPSRREFHRQAIGLGLLKSVSASEYLKNQRKFDRFDAIGPGRDLLDPETETNAATGLLRSCLTTLKQSCARRGLHWIRVLRQVALENHVLDTLDIALDLSKGQGGQATGNTRSKADQEAAAATPPASKNTRSKGASK